MSGAHRFVLPIQLAAVDIGTALQIWFYQIERINRGKGVDQGPDISATHRQAWK